MDNLSDKEQNKGIKPNEKEDILCDEELCRKIKAASGRISEEGKHTYLTILKKGVRVLIKGTVRMISSRDIIEKDDI